VYLWIVNRWQQHLRLAAAALARLLGRAGPLAADPRAPEHALAHPRALRLFRADLGDGPAICGVWRRAHGLDDHRRADHHRRGAVPDLSRAAGEAAVRAPSEFNLHFMSGISQHGKLVTIRMAT